MMFQELLAVSNQAEKNFERVQKNHAEPSDANGGPSCAAGDSWKNHGLVFAKSQVKVQTVVKDMIERRQLAQQWLEPLVEKSKAMKERTKQKAQGCAMMAQQFIENREKMYEWLDELSENKDELVARIKGLEAQRQAIEKEKNDLYILLEQAWKRAEKSRKAVKKWCWVPGYNIYLLVESEQDSKRLEKKMQETKDKEKQLQEQINQLLKRSDGMGAAVQDIWEKVEAYTQRIDFIAQKITDYNRMTCQMNEFYCQYSYLYEGVKHNNGMESVVDALKEANEVMAKLAEQETKMRALFQQDPVLSDGLTFDTWVYRGNVLYRGQNLQPGEYLASLNQQYVAVLGLDCRWVVRDTRRELAVVSAHTEEVSLGEDGMLRFENNALDQAAEILIMQDDGNLVAYDSQYKPLWASNTWQPGESREKPFAVLLPWWGGDYRIGCQNNTWLFVDDMGQLKIARDRQHGVQRFVLEQMECGAYKITARSDGKSLTASGDAHTNGGVVMKKDFCNEKNQLFWILPSREKGWVKLVAVQSSKVLDVRWGNFNDFTPIQQYYENGSQAQMFRVVQ